MFGELFHDSPLLLYPLLGLVIFMLVFAGAAARAWRKPAAMREQLARLPLGDDAEVCHE